MRTPRGQWNPRSAPALCFLLAVGPLPGPRLGDGASVINSTLRAFFPAEPSALFVNLVTGDCRAERHIPFLIRAFHQQVVKREDIQQFFEEFQSKKRRRVDGMQYYCS